MFNRGNMFSVFTVPTGNIFYHLMFFYCRKGANEGLKLEQQHPAAHVLWGLKLQYVFFFLLEIWSKLMLTWRGAVANSCDPDSLNRTTSSAEIFASKGLWARLTILTNKRTSMSCVWLQFVLYFYNYLKHWQSVVEHSWAAQSRLILSLILMLS